MSLNPVDILGYAGTTLVVLSFLNRSMLRLRFLNTLGAAVITLYALLIDAWPLILLNALLAGINGYHYMVLVREGNVRL